MKLGDPIWNVPRCGVFVAKESDPSSALTYGNGPCNRMLHAVLAMRFEATNVHRSGVTHIKRPISWHMRPDGLLVLRVNGSRLIDHTHIETTVECNGGHSYQLKLNQLILVVEHP